MENQYKLSINFNVKFNFFKNSYFVKLALINRYKEILKYLINFPYILLAFSSVLQERKEENDKADKLPHAWCIH
jgi:hypothetical protein